jgi:hypothetical protein
MRNDHAPQPQRPGGPESMRVVPESDADHKAGVMGERRGECCGLAGGLR